MTYVWCSWLADALRAEGCTVAEDCGDWAHRGRPSSTGAFNPYAVLLHHTGATASASNPFPSKSTLINGRSDLPGPLCHVGIGYDGVCHMVAAGRANHAGTNRGSGPVPAGDGNAQMIGVEIDYNGTQAISAAQKDAATRVAAACVKRFKRNADYVRIHAETSTSGKWDTGGVSGATWRSLVTAQIQDGDDMPTAQEIADAVWNKQINSSWSGGPVAAYGLLSQANYYAISAGLIGDNPPGGQYAGTPTTAKQLSNQITAGEDNSTEVRAALVLAGVAVLVALAALLVALVRG